MMRRIASLRLHNQQIAATQCKGPAEIVARLLAMQAQDYLGTLWAVGLRLPHSTEAAIEQALAERTIVRTWPMRGTLHIVSAEDVRWMLNLLAPRRLAQQAYRRRQLDIDEATLSRSREVCREALQGGKQLARPAMFAVLNAHNIGTGGQRGIHILSHLAQEGLLCLGAREGKQFTFALLDEWAPQARRLDRDEALAELARRYFTGHGPATVQDFAWWTGQTLGDARRSLAAAAPDLVQEQIDGRLCWMAPLEDHAADNSAAVYLLPGFDEFMLGYADRSAILDPQFAHKIHPGANGMLHPTLIIEGTIQGTWHRTLKARSVHVTVVPFVTLSGAQRRATSQETERLADFLGLSLELKWEEA
jgi:hypothetical protein